MHAQNVGGVEPQKGYAELQGWVTVSVADEYLIIRKQSVYFLLELSVDKSNLKIESVLTSELRNVLDDMTQFSNVQYVVTRKLSIL